MLRRLVKREDCGEREELSDEASPVDVFPAATVDSVLLEVSVNITVANLGVEHTLPTMGPMMTIKKTKASEIQIPICLYLFGSNSGIEHIAI